MLVTNLKNFPPVSMSLIILLNNPLVLFPGEENGAISFNFVVSFWTMVDENRIMTKSQFFIISTTKTSIFKIFCPFLMILLELMVLTLRVGNFLLRSRSRFPNIGIMIISKELKSSVKNDFYFFELCN